MLIPSLHSTCIAVQQNHYPLHGPGRGAELLDHPAMPAIQMFGRRWALAADDIPVLAFPAAVFHGIWFIFLVVGFSAIQRPSACAKVPSYETCIIGLFICFFLSCVLEGWLVREGLKGIAMR